MTTIGEKFRDNVDTLVAEYIEELKEENKTLKEENVRLVQNLAEYKNDITDLKEENEKLKKKYDGLTMYPQDMKELKEENIKLKEFLDITVQTKNEKIRNLLDEIEYYKKQCGED